MLANIPSTFVFYFQNIDKTDQVKECDVDWNEPVSELSEIDQSGLERFFCYSLSGSQDIEPAVSGLSCKYD